MALTVNGVEISEAQVAGEMNRLRADYVEYVAQNGGEASESQLREWAEENLVEAELFRQEAAATQPEPSDDRARQWVSEHQAYYDQVPEEERVARAKDDLRVRRLEKEVRKHTPRPSEEEVRREYEEHADQYVTPEMLRLSHVCRVIAPGGSTRASGYLELLRVKSDLAKGDVSWYQAVEASDTYQEDRGLFDAVARGDLPRDVEEQLFALAPGQVSDVIDFGGRSLHLFRVLAVDAPAQVPFEAVRERLSQSMFERGCQVAMEATFDALKAKAAVRR